MNELAKIIMDVSQNPEKSNLTKIQDWFQGEGRGITATKDIPLKNPTPETSRSSNDVSNNDPLKLDDIANSPRAYELTPLSKDTADSLKDENWNQDVIEKITSEEEAQIYKNANVEPAEVNGKPVLARNDIDPDLEGPDGKTNLERMREGNAPYYADENGKLKRYELHHIGQHPDKGTGGLAAASCVALGEIPVEYRRQEHLAVAYGACQRPEQPLRPGLIARV